MADRSPSSRRPTLTSYVYFNIELDSHDVVFAEGTACETLLDSSLTPLSAVRADSIVQRWPCRTSITVAQCAFSDPGHAYARSILLGIVSRNERNACWLPRGHVVPCSLFTRRRAHRLASYRDCIRRVVPPEHPLEPFRHVRRAAALNLKLTSRDPYSLKGIYWVSP